MQQSTLPTLTLYFFIGPVKIIQPQENWQFFDITAQQRVGIFWQFSIILKESLLRAMQSRLPALYIKPSQWLYTQIRAPLMNVRCALSGTWSFHLLQCHCDLCVQAVVGFMYKHALQYWQDFTWCQRWCSLLLLLML